MIKIEKRLLKKKTKYEKNKIAIEKPNILD